MQRLLLPRDHVSLHSFPTSQTTSRQKANNMRIATPRVADTGEMTASKTNKTTKRLLRSKASTGARHWSQGQSADLLSALSLYRR